MDLHISSKWLFPRYLTSSRHLNNTGVVVYRILNLGGCRKMPSTRRGIIVISTGVGCHPGARKTVHSIDMPVGLPTKSSKNRVRTTFERSCLTAVTTKESAGTSSKSYFTLHMQVTAVGPITRTVSFAKLSLTFSFLKFSISDPPSVTSSVASHHFLFSLTFVTTVQHSILFLPSPLLRFSKYFPLTPLSSPLLISDRKSVARVRA